MSGIQERLATGKGKFTPLYPEFGTDPVTYDDCTSPEFFAWERKAGPWSVRSRMTNTLGERQTLA